MRKMDERTQVKEAIRNFICRWGYGTYGADDRKRAVGKELSELDQEKATSDQVAEIIGNNSWAKPMECGECGTPSWNIVEIGEQSDGEGNAAYLCRQCLMEGAEMLSETFHQPTETNEQRNG